MDKNAIAAELIKRGKLTAEQAAAMGYGQAAMQGRTGQLAPGGPAGVDTKTDQATLATLTEERRKALSNAKAAQEFVKINETQPTGGINGLGFPWKGGGDIGDIRAMFDPELGKMRALTSQITPALRIEGSGSSTEPDQRRQEQGYVNIRAPGPVNQQQAKRYQKQSDYAAAESAFKDRWFAKYGTLTGSDPAFQSFWTKREAGDPVANNVQTKRLRFNPATGDFE